MVNITAIIPARVGSKRLPGKNIKHLDGRPLIAYSVLTALSIRSVNRVVVASDSDMILNEAYTVEDGGETILVKLPPDLTTDDAPLTETLKYAVEHSIGGSDWVVLLQPTCPLRQPGLCERWIQTVLANNTAQPTDGLLTVDHKGYKVGYDHNGFMHPHYDPMTPKADIIPSLIENGVFYMFKTENVLKGEPWPYKVWDDLINNYVNVSSRMIPVTCPPEQSLANIDTPLDWFITEFLATNT